MLEAGCGAGRVTLGLWSLGYRRLTAFDFAEELVDQARSLAAERSAEAIEFHYADATQLRPPAGKPNDAQVSAEHRHRAFRPRRFGGALFMFNGMMQIPGRENRRQALRELHRVCRPGARFLFSTHDRNCSRSEKMLWRLEKSRWERKRQDPRLLEFGDRYFEICRRRRLFRRVPLLDCRARPRSTSSHHTPARRFGRASFPLSHRFLRRPACSWSRPDKAINSMQIRVPPRRLAPEGAGLSVCVSCSPD